MDTGIIQEKVLKTTDRFHKIRLECLLPDLSKREYELLAVVQDYMDGHSGGSSANDEKNGNGGSGRNGSGICISGLAERLQVSSPAVSRMVGTLEEKGYIGRGTGKEDRRNTYITLTEKGKEAKAASEAALCGLMERVTLRMGERDMEELLRLWNRLADIMEKELETKHV